MNNRQNHKDDLAGEHPFGDTGQLIFFIVFLVVWAADSFFIRYSTGLAKYISLFIRIPLAVILLVAAAYLTRSGMDVVHAGRRGKPGIFNKGAFALVRHPVYLGSILFYLGLTVLTFSISAAAVSMAIIVFYDYIARHEERLLLDKYGNDYESYMTSVARWVPRFKSR